MSAALELNGISCVRGNRTLFDALNAAVQPGQLLRVQGANGAGKTSLLRMMCGLLAPAAGEVRWQGEPVAQLREEFGRQLIYVGHAAALKDDLTGLENLLTASTLGGTAVQPAQAAVALAEAGLRGRESVPVRRLSQGQRRRVALARLALGAACGLWVLDEPFNALDTSASAWLHGLITAQLARGGVVVLTSHQSVVFSAAVHEVVVSL